MTFTSRSPITALRQQCIVSLGNATYYLRNRVERTLPLETAESKLLLPAVVFNVGRLKIDTEVLGRVFHDFETRDDVFTPQFVHGGLLLPQNVHPDQSQDTLSTILESYLETKSARVLLMKTSESENLPEGPYFLHGRDLHQAWRIYADEFESFTAGVVPDDHVPYNFHPLQATAPNGVHGAVAVPSRLYFPPLPGKPLNGLRVTIKDNMHLSGVITTLGSRSYAALYPTQNTTAQIVKTLIDQGAQIIGKSKLSAYATAEVPPEKTIDYLAPFNARGDSYQGPSGSSSGAGSTVAGYDWVDLALGTDTSGSIRMPAASYGLWGIKTSYKSFDLAGVVPSAPSLDVLGMLSCDPAILKQAIDLSSTKPMTTKQRLLKPTQIIYPTDWYPMANKEQQDMQEEFLAILEDYAGIKHTKLSLKDLWASSGPEEHRSTPLEDYLATSAYHPFYYESFHAFDAFRADHEKKFGKKPYVSPHVESRWTAGLESSQVEVDQALTELQTFTKWILAKVLVPKQDGSSGVIIMMPLGRPGNNPRDIVPPPSGSLKTSAYDIISFASMTGFPQLVVPIGQNPYKSRASGLTEYAPIVASLLGVAGSDAWLLHVALNALEKAGWPTEVLSGRYAFPLGDNRRNTVDSPSGARL